MKSMVAAIYAASYGEAPYLMETSRLSPLIDMTLLLEYMSCDSSLFRTNLMFGPTEPAAALPRPSLCTICRILVLPFWSIPSITKLLKKAAVLDARSPVLLDVGF